MDKGKFLLIDGDILRYRCGFAAEKKEYIVASVFEGFNTWSRYDNKKEAKERISRERDAGSIDYMEVFERTVLQPVENCLQMVDTQLKGIFDALEPVDFTIYLSGHGNFRTKIAETREYKASRAPRPTHYKAIGEHLVRKYGAQVVNGREADDALGVDLSADPRSRCIVSIDKDLNQISGWHFNFVESRPYWVSRRDGDFAFYLQMLTGDSTDNVPGIDGIGEVSARRILEGARSSRELCQRVWARYKAQPDLPQGNLRYFREQAGLLWIQRTGMVEYTPPGGWDTLI